MEQVASFSIGVRDPFLELLIGVVSEPHGSEIADQARLATRDWWDRYGNGPTCDELLAAVFEPDDWCAVVEDPGRTMIEREAQTQLLRSWVVQYWTRVGAICFMPGIDAMVRPGAAADPDLRHARGNGAEDEGCTPRHT